MFGNVWCICCRFGESAGEATEDVFATAGHCCGTAWNIFKIRKAINPASSVSAGMLRTVAQNRTRSHKNLVFLSCLNFVCNA